MDNFDDLLSGHDDGVDIDGNPINKKQEQVEEIITEEPIVEEIMHEEPAIIEESVQEEEMEDIIEEEQVVEEEIREIVKIEEVIEEAVEEQQIVEEPEPVIEKIVEVVEEIAEEEVVEENATENVIEEVKEKVAKEHKKPEPREHDAVAESLNRPDDDDGIVKKEIGQVMHESMIPYSEFVIMDRALPRVEDGLKPVQRRILYAMHDMGLYPDKPFRKSAGIVGECLGKYHPHGDTSVYDAMVRLAQPFNVNMPLVLGQGNFGSEDGDPPAAMRYTEAKLNPLALELLRDIDKETVPFSLTFDDRNTEPDILPGRYPNLLTNGATGIAVGLATNIPPHNLGEVIDAHIAYIDDPKITLAKVMKIIRGPDFPTGGFVVVGDDLVSAYTSGKGRVVMRGKVHIEVESNDRRNIVITEVPYQVNKVTLQRNIADLRESKKGALSGIQEIRDESDRKGMRIVIRIKKEFDAKEICNLLFKYTNLQCNFNINMVAIAGGKPKSMGLLDIIAYYVNFQREVIYKRCVFDLNNAKERAHILEGLLIAIKNIDEVIRIIKTSKHTTEARERLRKTFELTERQAQAILDLRLARLTSLEVYKLEQELKELYALIEKLEAIIASKKKQFDVVKTELLEIKRKYKIDRRSRIIGSLEEAVITADDDEKPIEEAVIAITPEGTIKRFGAKHFSMSKSEFNAGNLSDIHTAIITTQTNKLLYTFTNLGNCYKIMAGDIPECRMRDKGATFKSMFKDAPANEKPVSVYALDCDITEMDKPVAVELGELVWLTKYGMIKRSVWAESCGIQKSVFPCYKLREDKPDAVVNVQQFKAGNTLLLMSSGGNVLHAQTGDVPLQGRMASGVKGISMGDDEFAASNCIAKQNHFVVAVTNKGMVKKSAVKDIEKMVRYRKGVKFGGLDKGEFIVFATSVKGEEDLVVVCDNGKVLSMPIEKIATTDRTKPFKGGFGKVNVKDAFVHRRKKNN